MMMEHKINSKQKLKDEKFYNTVLKLLEEEVVMKFDKRIGEPSDFYENKEKKQ